MGTPKTKEIKQPEIAQTG